MNNVHHTMRIYLREILEDERISEFNEKHGWLLASLEKADEVVFTEEWPEKPRQIDLELRTFRTEQIYWLKGKIKAEIGLICSRCGEPFVFHCAPPFQHLYSKDKSITGGADAHTQGREAYENANDPDSLSELDQHSDHDINLIEEEFIEIDPLVTEHLLIATPFQPKCDVHGGKENCIVPMLPENIEIPVKNNPFSVLKSLKVNKNDSH